MRLWELIKRNFRETQRDYLALGFLIGFPLVFMLLFGVAFGGSNSPSYAIGVIDRDHSQLSQAFVTQVLSNVPTFDIKDIADDETAARKSLTEGDLRGYIILPTGFGAEVQKSQQQRPADIHLVLTYDQSDMLVSGQISGTMASALSGFAGVPNPVHIETVPIQIAQRITNIDFIAPGVIVFGILIMIPTAARLMVSDKSRGFMNRLLVSPTRPVEFIIAYSASMAAIAVVQILLFMAVAAAFGMDFIGSAVLAFVIFLLTALSSVGLGMVLAAVVKNENQSEPLAWLFSMPIAIISGAWFSREFMPAYLRSLGDLFPFAHAIEASRAVINRGAGLAAVSGDVYFLVAWTVGVFSLGVFLFGRTMRN